MKTRASLAILGITTAGLIALGPAATASHGGGGVTKTGSCSAASSWKVKVKTNNGALEVEGEVDSNVVGQTWNWLIRDNGVQRASGTARTTGPSGSFAVTRTIPNQAGADAVVFRAVNPSTGEVCRGAITF